MFLIKQWWYETSGEETFLMSVSFSGGGVLRVHLRHPGGRLCAVSPWGRGGCGRCGCQGEEAANWGGWKDQWRLCEETVADPRPQRQESVSQMENICSAKAKTSALCQWCRVKANWEWNTIAWSLQSNCQMYLFNTVHFRCFSLCLCCLHHMVRWR